MLKTKKYGKIEYIDPEKLKIPEESVRKITNWDSIKKLGKNMKNFGILQPLEINQKNEVIIGTRRLRAARIASLEKVPVIKRDTGEFQKIEKQLSSNIHSEKLTVREKAKAFKYIMDLKVMDKTTLSKYLGVSVNYICRVLAILEASEETQKLIESGKISERMASSILYRLKDKSKEDYVFKKIIEDN
ncbi:MAG: ParB/RepB/Spo0J family partition protein [Candidatus Woesearchaeota archaeon]